MTYTIRYSSRFKKSLKRIKQLPGFQPEKLKAAVKLLAAGKSLPQQYRDHKLTGNLKDFRECHLAPDILLLYQIDDNILTLILVNIDSHAQLFGK